MRIILIFTLTLLVSYQIVAIADNVIPTDSRFEKDYLMCYQTNIHMIKDEVLKAKLEQAQTVVKNFCRCVVPYIDNAYKVKFDTLFSCIRTKSKMKQINLKNVDPVIQKECERESQSAMKKITNAMIVNCKQYQFQLNKIFDKNKPCGGGACK